MREAPATGDEAWRGRLVEYLDDNAATWTAIAGAGAEPGLVDPETFVTFGLLEAAGRAWTVLHRGVLGQFGLNHSEWTTIAMLRTSPPAFRRSPTELRHLVGQTSAGMARILDKLERAGLIGREHRPQDRRGLDVVLRPEGRAVAEASFGRLHLAQRAVLERLGTADRAAGIAALERLLEALDPADAEPVPAGPARATARTPTPTPGGTR